MFINLIKIISSFGGAVVFICLFTCLFVYLFVCVVSWWVFFIINFFFGGRGVFGGGLMFL